MVKSGTKSLSDKQRIFLKKFRSEIVPAVRIFENERKKKLFWAVLSATALCAVGLFLIFIAAISGHHILDKSNEGCLKLAILAFAGAWGVWAVIKKGFENKIKEKIMPVVCGCFGNMKWTQGEYSQGKLFTEAGAVPDFTSEDYDDVFRGTYETVKFEIIEPEYEIGSGKNRRTVFNGVIVKFDMNKKFTGHTVIKPNALLKLPPKKGLKHTELEDIEFNKRFDVYTNDEVDARYLITTAFMERLKAMKTAFKARSVGCAFYKHFLIVTLPTGKDIFSICSLVKRIDDTEQYFTMFEEIDSIVKLIEHFKLNERTGL